MNTLNTFKTLSFTILFFLISNLTAIPRSAFADSSDNKADTDWNLTWSDEFNEDTIDQNNWTYDNGGHGWGNDELQYYTDRTENSRIENGNLVIEARKENYKGSTYTSARLKSQGLQNFLYGKIEARMKIPKGQGLWPAFWMLGSNMAPLDWPDCGELDIMEHVNNEESICGTIHWKNSEGLQSEGGMLYNIDVTQFHTYSIEWSPDSIKWLVDDIPYYEYSIKDNVNGTSPYHKPFFIVLNLAVGGNYPKNPDSSTVFPAKLYVDYVRVYSKSANAKGYNAWYKDNGNMYYLDGNGDIYHGWLYLKDYWYYLNDTGSMHTGWLNYNDDWYYFNENGIMQTGWINDHGNWYYLYSTGEMAHDTMINSFYVNSNGAWII